MTGGGRPGLRLILLLLVLPLAGCLARGETHPPLLLQDHPLSGRIWEVAAGRFLDEAELVDRLARARYLLLGEKHDNPDHHRLQARVVAQLAARGRRPAVAFEMLDQEDAATLARHLAQHPGDVDGVAEAVAWADSGWPEWPLYRPIFAAALQARLPLAAANLSRTRARQVVKEGLGALEPMLVSRFALATPLPAEIAEALAETLRESHCHHLPEAMIEPMRLAQRARDAQMAATLLDHAGDQGAILIAGTGHVVRDRAVPRYLALVEPQAPVAVVAFEEVARDEPDPAAYARPDQADYLWFTPRVDELDPCAKFAGQFKG